MAQELWDIVLMHRPGLLPALPLVVDSGCTYAEIMEQAKILYGKDEVVCVNYNCTLS